MTKAINSSVEVCHEIEPYCAAFRLVANREDPTEVIWKRLKDVLPGYWITVFADEIDPAWTV